MVFQNPRCRVSRPRVTFHTAAVLTTPRKPLAFAESVCAGVHKDRIFLREPWKENVSARPCQALFCVRDTDRGRVAFVRAKKRRRRPGGGVPERSTIRSGWPNDLLRRDRDWVELVDSIQGAEYRVTGACGNRLRCVVAGVVNSCLALAALIPFISIAQLLKLFNDGSFGMTRTLFSFTGRAVPMNAVR